MKTKCLLYCTKAKPYLKKCNHFMALSNHKIGNEGIELNGTIALECETECEKQLYKCGSPYPYENQKGTCLTDDELEDYAFQCNIGFAPALYYLHIHNLKVLDEPLKLSEVKSTTQHLMFEKDLEVYAKEESCAKLLKINEWVYGLDKAPSNMQWVYYKGEKYALISIRSPWYCKIANGEKTIEVRKKVLKGMI